MMTSATSDAGTLPRARTSLTTMEPSSCALSELIQPLKFPIGVLPAATITTSELLYPELAAIAKEVVRRPTRISLGTSLGLYVLSYITSIPKIAINWAGMFAGSAFLKQENGVTG